ncbi:MAG: helix-turn-helix domain-containing protein [Burkholderiaceae bacterium]
MEQSDPEIDSQAAQSTLPGPDLPERAALAFGEVSDPGAFLKAPAFEAGTLLGLIVEQGEDVHRALRRALRAAEMVDVLEDRAQAGALYRAIATLHALLGHHEDANEWVGRTLRATGAQNVREELSRTDTMRTALSHLAGDMVGAIRLANNALGRHSRRVGDPCRNLLLALLGQSYLQLGQISKASQCAAAIVKGGSLSESDPGASLGLLLQGDLVLRRALVALPLFRGELLCGNEADSEGVDRPARSRMAHAAYQVAFEHSYRFGLFREMAIAGMARARLLLNPRQSDFDQLVKHLHAMDARGLIYERDRTRLNLAVLYLVHDGAREARNWLAPLAQTALMRPGTLLEYDVLFCAALAAARSGDARQGLAYLSEYNARIRAQNLTRVSLPPPNIDPAGPRRPYPAVERRGRARDENALVERVAALVREHPGAPTHSSDLAAMEGISRRSLEYKLRRATGKSPREFVTAIRLELAHAALKNEPANDAETLTALAMSLGFRSYRSFTQAYRKAFGSYPAQAAQEANVVVPDAPA